jgi:uncharacterized protein (DUF885 family)
MRRLTFAVLALMLLLPAGCASRQVTQMPVPTTVAATLPPAATHPATPAAMAAPTLVPAQPAHKPVPASPEATGAAQPTSQPDATGPAVDEVMSALKGLPLEDFFAESYKQLLLRNPEGLTTLGLAESFGLRNDQLNNLSDAFVRETQALQAAMLEALRSYDRAALTPDQQLSYDVYAWWLEDQVRGQEFMYHNYPLNHFLFSYDINLTSLFADIQPVRSAQDVEDYLSRLSLVDDQVSQLLEGLRLREELGIVPPTTILERTLDNLRSTADNSPDETPFYQALRQKVQAIPGTGAANQGAWLAQAKEEIARSVQPAFAEMAIYVEHLLTIATDDAGVWKLPEGDAYYRFLLHRETTTDLTPNQIHDLGLAEVARIQAEMRTIFDELGYPSGKSLSSLMDRAMQEGGFYDASLPGGKDQVVQAYQVILDEASAQLDRVVDLRPRAGLAVVADSAIGTTA